MELFTRGVDFINAHGIGAITFVLSVLFGVWLLGFLERLTRKAPPPTTVSQARFSDDVNAILDALNHPSKWKEDGYTIDHTSGLSLWIANGKDCCRVWKPTQYSFKRWDELTAVWNAIEKMKRRKVITLLEG